MAVSSVRQFNAPHSGGKYLTIFGRGFSSFDISPSSRVALAETSATVWTSGSLVACKVASVLKTFASSVIVSVQQNFANSHSNAYSFDTASNLDLMHLHSFSTTGNDLILLTARNVGFPQMSIRLRLGFSGCSASVLPPNSQEIYTHSNPCCRCGHPIRV
jgi:hypothetical protein